MEPSDAILTQYAEWRGTVNEQLRGLNEAHHRHANKLMEVDVKLDVSLQRLHEDVCRELKDLSVTVTALLERMGQRDLLEAKRGGRRELWSTVQPLVYAGLLMFLGWWFEIHKFRGR
jgi:hypothetical protein